MILQPCRTPVADSKNGPEIEGRNLRNGNVLTHAPRRNRTYNLILQEKRPNARDRVPARTYVLASSRNAPSLAALQRAASQRGRRRGQSAQVAR